MMLYIQQVLGAGMAEVFFFERWDLFKGLLGGSSHDLQVVGNHGDRKSPAWVVGPLPNGLNTL